MARIADAGSQRYVYVDALRGVASFAVLICHLFMYSVLSGRLNNVLPPASVTISQYGAYGVQIFFVLSGFVIAHSLRNNALNGSSLVNFMVRRQLRLDPPYWTVLFFALLIGLIKQRIPSVADPLPGALEVFLNALYLNFIIPTAIAQKSSIVGGAWTLSLEIQFYLLFMGVLMIGNALRRRKATGEITAPMLVLTYVTGIISLYLSHLPIGYFWFYRYWFYFVAGVLAYWSFRKLIAQWWFLSFFSLFGASFLWSLLFGTHDSVTAWEVQKTSALPLMVALLTTFSLWFIGVKGKITKYGSNPWLQYLGEISYSLYLVHMTVIPVILYFGHKLTGTSLVSAVLWMVIAGLCSIGLAHLLNRFVEFPSMRFAASLKTESSSAG